MAGMLAVCFVASALALDPNRKVSQFIRTGWGPEKGFMAGSVSSISQTPDGYLWIGTEKGLLRFDGLNFRKFDQASPVSLPIGPVQKLLTDNEGNLWILLRTTKLLRYHDGSFDFSHAESENGVTAMGLGHTGAILLSSAVLGTLTYHANDFVTVSPALVFPDSAALAQEGIADDRSTRLSWSAGLTTHRFATPNTAVTSMAASADGKIWLGTEDRGLFYLSEGKIYAAKGAPATRISCLLSLEGSQMWIGTAKGVMLWNGRELTRTGVPESLLHVEVLSMLRDRDSNTWVGTNRGLLQLNAKGISSFRKRSRITDAAVAALFEDREGNIWIGGPGGLERLRDSAFISYAVPSSGSQSVGPLYLDPNDRIWFAPLEGGLRRLKGGTTENVQIVGSDIVYSITARDNDIWLGRRRGGLTHLHSINGSLTSNSYTQANGLAQNSVYAVYVSRDGTVWAGTLSAGVSALRNRHFITYTTANGLASDTVSSITEDPDGTMWFGTPDGLTSMSKSGWRTYSARDGLPSPDVNCLLRDSQGVLWIGTAVGLSLLTHDHIEVPRKLPDSLHEPIFGIAEDRNDWLWIATTRHILQVKRSGLMGNALTETDVREYGIENGLQGTEGVKRFQSVVTDSQGKIWFSTNRGLSVVNPARATVNPVPALVHIEAVIADGTPIDLRAPLQIPAAKQKMTFRYAGLSLSNSERVRYRYKLEGFDQGWSEPVTNLEASYGNLGAGSYRFHVMASNGDGLWNGSEAAVGFKVEPTVWQTWWFRLSGALCAGLLILLAYRLRMHQLTKLLNVRFEERLAERTRIAQELHDTLLQGLLSISMQLHVAMDQLPDDSPARTTLNRVMQLMGPVIEDGRNTIRGLRSSIQNPDDLMSAFSQIPRELNDKGADFRAVIEGASVPLRPSIRDEIYRIGREALTNAFRHSGASNIHLQLEYTTSHLRILVADDGCGISSQVLEFGREGHWGLPGIRERAAKIGGKLRVMSRLGRGTEIELCVPSHVVFESAPSSAAFNLLNFHRRQKHSELARK
jgi:ligand-binding sensor domain-containing protein/signal transduction histidine kinase